MDRWMDDGLVSGISQIGRASTPLPEGFTSSDHTIDYLWKRGPGKSLRLSQRRSLRSHSLECLKSVADLDGFPPRPVAPAKPQLPQHPVQHRQAAPPPQRRDSAVQEQRPDQGPPPPYPIQRGPYAELQEQLDNLPNFDAPGAEGEEAEPMINLSPLHNRSGRVRVPKSPVLNMPMVEVAGANGPLLVLRPWGTTDIMDAGMQLPDPREVGGKKFSVEIQRFCRDFRPTSHELRHMLMKKLGVDISRIQYQWPDNALCQIDMNWDAENNAPYRDMITAVRQACVAAFPVRMDMSRISMCKQQDGETVIQYLTRLTEVHDAHSGLNRPDNINAGEVMAYEAHLRNSFLNGLKEGIARSVK
ncbi:uncharacterized protein LOC131370461 [Hemibagrus wyckioides]|uniref:uncharacterized protein LOC131370461 n=1 Tax=Hemibagrus wyckioides TaxID=337641 RepID=UPI00266B883F|nr:uncharacterized protein LOC131370461 [Hemibagrus wyckioides]